MGLLGDGGAEAPDDLDAVRPYLDLAREIQREVEAVAADPRAGSEALVQAITAVPDRERARVVQAVFEKLPPTRQWEIIEAAFGDDQIRAYLADERAVRLDQVERTGTTDAIARRARVAGRLDVRDLPAGVLLRVGLFRPVDVRAAVKKGQRSDTCARLLAVRPTGEDGDVRVVDDTFNPRGGLFVSREYDEAAWRAERLPSHSVVRLGSVADTPADEATDRPSVEPVLYPSARVDVVVENRVVEGRLHLGFAILDERDVFADLD